MQHGVQGVMGRNLGCCLPIELCPPTVFLVFSLSSTKNGVTNDTSTWGTVTVVTFSSPVPPVPKRTISSNSSKQGLTLSYDALRSKVCYDIYNFLQLVHFFFTIFANSNNMFSSTVFTINFSDRLTCFSRYLVI